MEENEVCGKVVAGEGKEGFVKKVDSGIYRDEFDGTLFFVLGLSRDTFDKPIRRVISHPLSSSEGAEWEVGLTAVFFLGYLERNEGSFPRYTKLLDWNLPNILPGTRIRNTGIDDKIYTIRRIYERGSRLMVEIVAENSYVDGVSLPLEHFKTGEFILA